MLLGMDKDESGPRFRLHLTEKPFHVEYPNILQVQVASKPESSFQWFQGDQPIEAGVSTPNVRIHSEGNKSVLYLRHATEGEYTVRAENVYGAITSTAYYKATEGFEETGVVPQFAVPLPTIVNLMDGDEVTLCCQVGRVVGRVDEGPIPFVTWYHNGEEIKEKAKSIVVNQTEEGVCTLKITEVFPEDSGEYVCKVANSKGEGDLTKATVNVEGRK
jgi:hypothetical protein